MNLCCDTDTIKIIRLPTLVILMEELLDILTRGPLTITRCIAYNTVNLAKESFSKIKRLNQELWERTVGIWEGWV